MTCLKTCPPGFGLRSGQCIELDEAGTCGTNTIALDPTASGQICACVDAEMDIDNDCSCKTLVFGSECVSKCPAFSYEESGVCECFDTFIMKDNTCVCNYLVSLDQKKCTE